MKKKIFTSSVLIIALLLTGCGGTGSNDANSNEAEIQVVSNETESKEMTFEELTVVDNEFCKIVINGIDPDNIWGYTLKTHLENKSTDKNYMFSVMDASINNVQIDPFFASEVAPSKMANEEICFPVSTLEDNGIDLFTDIEMTFHVYDNDDWTSDDDVALETVHVYPYGEENAANFIRQPADTDNVLIDNELATVTVIENKINSIGGFELNLFIQNKSNMNLMFNVDNASINGYMSDPFWAKSILPGKCAFTTISWSSYDLEENEITEVSNIEFNLNAYDDNNWLSDDVINQDIIIEIK